MNRRKNYNKFAQLNLAIFHALYRPMSRENEIFIFCSLIKIECRILSIKKGEKNEIFSTYRIEVTKTHSWRYIYI